MSADREKLFDHGPCVVVRVARDRHQCSPPGWRQRRKVNLDFGSVWQCACSQQWKWDFNYAGEFWERV